MHPILIDFGQISLLGYEFHLRLPAYGTFYAAALVIGWLMVKKLGRERYPDAPWTDIFFISAIAGIAGARLLNGITVLPDVLAGRVPFKAVLQGGGVWLGGALTAFVVFVLLCHRSGVDKGVGINVLFTAIPLGHAVGRIGCLLGGCCYGAECHLPWAITFTDSLAHQVNRTPLNVPLHPTQLYEFGVEMINFVICYRLWRANPRPWSIAIVWFGLYGGQRFFLEFVRADYRGGMGGLSPSQWLSFGMVIVAIALISSWIRGGTFLKRASAPAPAHQPKRKKKARKR